MPGPEVKTNRGYGPQPLWQRLLVGWGGSAHSRECLVQTTGDYAFSAHLLAHRFFPSFLNAGARERVRVHTNTHTPGFARAQSTLRHPANLPFPLGGPDAQVAEQEEGGAKKEKSAFDPQDFLPASFPNHPLGSLFRAA